ncbi:MAG TPA: hypothetical protein ENF87_01225 [Thermoproteales archaeon]|nr:hypothetical protein [Thermoproteales archaeon]
MENYIIELLRDTRNLILDLLQDKQALHYTGKGFYGDKTLRIDLLAEKNIIRGLFEHYSNIAVFSEERGLVKKGEPKTFFILDPIDGSTNISRKIPFASISLAKASKNHSLSLEEGYVIDLFSGDIYWAVKGEGAWKNNQKIHVREVHDFEDLVLSFQLGKGSLEYFNRIKRLLVSLKHVRNLGSVALELCYVAEGKLDGLIDLRGLIRNVDIAAGHLIVEEAGGLFLDDNFRRVEYFLDRPWRGNIMVVSLSTLKLIKSKIL